MIPASKPWSVGVVIPAQNEASTVRRCIRSVLRARDRGGSIGKLWVVVVADSCADSTAKLARRALGTHGTVLEGIAGSPGKARQWGVAAALEYFRGSGLVRDSGHAFDPRSIWIANTDADTVVSKDWLQHHLYFADRGAAAVAGVVQVESIPGCDRASARRILEDYVIHGDGTHPHVHGANFGVRADAYLDAGGWKDLSVAEDHCLWGRLRTRGWDTASPSSSVVVTSGRLLGRACGGFADTLRSKLEHLRA